MLDREKKLIGIGCNYIESLLGIETMLQTDGSKWQSMGCNYIESLLGIETIAAMSPAHPRILVATILNPY